MFLVQDVRTLLRTDYKFGLLRSRKLTKTQISLTVKIRFGISPLKGYVSTLTHSTPSTTYFRIPLDLIEIRTGGLGLPSDAH